MAINLIESNKYYIEESFFQEVHQQTTLEGFDQLWQATEDSLPANYKTTFEKLEDQKEEQILYLNDALDLIQKENFRLREEMAEMQSKLEVYKKVSEDYVSVLELNRALTKQLNSVMALREKEQNQIQALKTLLA